MSGRPRYVTSLFGERDSYMRGSPTRTVVHKMIKDAWNWHLNNPKCYEDRGGKR